MTHGQQLVVGEVLTWLGVIGGWTGRGICKVVELGVCGPSWDCGGLDANEMGQVDVFMMVGVPEMALKPSVEQVVVPSNPEGGNWPMWYQRGRWGWRAAGACWGLEGDRAKGAMGVKVAAGR